jgi:N-acetylmuramoyl-L-alanine amidase
LAIITQMIKNITALTISIIILIAIAFAIYWSYQRPIPVVIQAGHEGRTTGNTGSVYKGNKEVEWNTLVANEVAKKLESWGIKTKRVGAKTPLLKAKIAIAIHFDGASKPCSSGASIGYPNIGSKKLALKWKRNYKKYYPFEWQKDNFTKNLSDYYAYYTIRAEKFLVLELGELTCDRQLRWLKPRRKKIAHLIAATIATEFGLHPKINFK